MPSISLGRYDDLSESFIEDALQVLTLIEQKRKQKPNSSSSAPHGRTRRS